MSNHTFTKTPLKQLFWSYTDHQVEHSIDFILSLRILFYLLYVLIFVVGIVGNVLVCYVVWRQSSMHTVTNLFITNLALSDILLCLFSVPFTPLYLLTFKQWVFGTLFCHLVPFAQGVSLYISVFSLMMIAIERYSVIVHPFRRPITTTSALVIIGFIWLLAIVFTLPYGIFIDVHPVLYMPNNRTIVQKQNYEYMTSMTTNNNKPSEDTLKEFLSKTKFYCDEAWPYDSLRIVFGLSTTAIQFIVPFCIISFCYAKVCTRLWDRIRTRPGTRNCSTQRKWLEKERARRTNSMLIGMVVIFAISWLPLNIYNLVEDFYSPVSKWSHSKSFFVGFHLIGMSSTCYNPFLYAWLNDNFRKEFKSVFAPIFGRLCSLFGVTIELTDEQSKELCYRGHLTLPGQSTNHCRSGTGKTCDASNTTAITAANGGHDGKNSTRITVLKGNEQRLADDECVSSSVLDTTTNLVTNLESIDGNELQESLLVTSIHNGMYANRVLSVPSSNNV